MQKVKISKDGASIDFTQSDKVPVSPKKFRQGPELEGFYRFIFENDLRKEALQVIDRIYLARKAVKLKKPLEALRAKAQEAALKASAAAKIPLEKAEKIVAKVAKKVEQPKPAKKVTEKKASSKKPVAKKASAKKAAPSKKSSAKKAVKKPVKKSKKK